MRLKLLRWDPKSPGGLVGFVNYDSCFSSCLSFCLASLSDELWRVCFSVMDCDLEVEAERDSLSSVIGKQTRKPDNLRHPRCSFPQISTNSCGAGLPVWFTSFFYLDDTENPDLKLDVMVLTWIWTSWVVGSAWDGKYLANKNCHRRRGTKSESGMPRFSFRMKQKLSRISNTGSPPLILHTHGECKCSACHPC